MTRTFVRRTWLGLALALPVLLLSLDAAYGQRGGAPGRPGVPNPAPNPGIPNPRVPNPNVPNPGMPNPNIPNPNVPNPNIPRPPNQRFVNQPPTIWITVWSCSRCSRELGRGNAAPGMAMCPHCGANFNAAAAPVSSTTEVPNPEYSAGLTAGLITVIVIGGIAVALGAAGLVILLSQRRASRLGSKYARPKTEGFEPAPEPDAAPGGPQNDVDWRWSGMKNADDRR